MALDAPLERYAGEGLDEQFSLGFDPSGWDWRATVRTDPGGTVVAAMTSDDDTIQADGTAQTVTLAGTLPPAGAYGYDLFGRPPGGHWICLVRSTLTVRPAETEGLP